MTPTQTLPLVDEEWDRALAIVAHPDDMEYGAASAVARWTAQGKSISYLLVTRGEAGIKSMAPDVVGPLRVAEQIASCAAVGVTDVRFLDYPDGLVVEGLELRRDLALAIRATRPDVILTMNHHESWGPGSWNHPDHRAVGRSILDAVGEASNPWLHMGADVSDSTEAWGGVRFVAVNASTTPTHGVDITTSIDAGIASLECHAEYLANLDGDMADPATFLTHSAQRVGPQLGVEMATLFEVIHF